MEIGRQAGLQKGIQAVALRLLKMGYNVVAIAEITGLSLQEIQVVKNEFESIVMEE